MSKNTAPAERLTYRPDELARVLGVSRATVWRRIADGTLKSTKVFGVRLVEAESVKALLSVADEIRKAP